MKILLLTTLTLFYISRAVADCTFNVTNYSDTPVMVEAGFYNGDKVKFKVDVASSNKAKVKNTLNCSAVSPAGFGVTYINLVDKLSSGGWAFTPANNMIRAFGTSFGSQDYIMGTSPGGTKLVLFNNTRPGTDTFDVRIEKASRNISRQLGSMN